MTGVQTCALPISFEAEEGCNDDLAMCLVIYAWLVAQDYFKELTEQDVRKRLYEEQKNQIEQDMSPFGFIMTGLEETSEVDVNGDVNVTGSFLVNGTPLSTSLTPANSWANTVGTAGNNYASILAANNAVGANNWANTVGTAGNNYTNSVGAAGN